MEVTPTGHSESTSDGLQEFDKVGFLCWGETLIIVIDHRQQVRRTPIVKYGACSEPAQPGRPVLSGGTDAQSDFRYSTRSRCCSAVRPSLRARL